jgi:MFS family permease
MVPGLFAQALLSVAYFFVANPLFFVVLRGVEGVAAASLLPSARALIADAMPDDQRGRAYGFFGACFNFGFLFGPAVGGLLIRHAERRNVVSGPAPMPATLGVAPEG